VFRNELPRFRQPGLRVRGELDWLTRQVGNFFGPGDFVLAALPLYFNPNLRVADLANDEGSPGTFANSATPNPMRRGGFRSGEPVR